MVFELTVDLYNWIITRGKTQEKQDNRPSKTTIQSTQLPRDFVQRIENGVTVGKLMAEIRKRILKVTNKPFTLDPSLTNMKNLST